MDRRPSTEGVGRSLTVALSLALGAALLGAAPAPGTSTPGVGAAADPDRAAADTRPNIVLLMADDMTYEELEAMPIVRNQLAARGVAFTRAYSPDPSCCPARATLLTGQYAQNHGVYANKPPRGSWSQYRDDEANSLPVWLDRAGYTTSWIGKYMNDYPGTEDPRTVPVGWDRWYVPTHGVYDYRRWTLNHDGRLRDQGPRYQTLAWRDEALRQVDQLSAEAAPFFLTVSFLGPHKGSPHDDDDVFVDGKEDPGTPFVLAQDRDDWSGVPVLDKPNIPEDNVRDKPEYVQEANARPIDRESLREAREQRREALASVDRAVGSLVQRLRDNGELDNTLVVFTSDNGYLLGEHGLLKKSLPYEESVRVPLVVRGPGFAEGAEVSVPVSHADLTPTFVRVADAEARRPQDGVSLFRVLAGGASWNRREILLQYEAPGVVRGKRMRWAGLRGTRWAYFEYANGERELYDMRRDPFQLHNVVDRREQAARVRGLHRQLAVLGECSGRACSRSATQRP